jgi:TonB family protein
VNRKETPSSVSPSRQFIFAFSLQILLAVAVNAQSSPGSSDPPASGSPAATPPVATVMTGEALQKRLERARALAGAHQLTAAASELESIRASVKDDVVRNNSSLMLMGIYLEDGNYARAESLLEEAFKERSAKNEGSIRTYFALAGQAVNGARAHLGRYRTFGINVSSSALPTEAVNDLERLRSLLERMSAQGKTLVRDNAKANDAFALLEDISGIRATLARDDADRSKWETEYSAARARLATLPTESALAGISPASGVDESLTRNAHPYSPTNAAGDSPVTKPTEVSQGAANVAAPAQGASNEPEPTADFKKTGAGSSLVEVGSLTERSTSKVIPNYPQLAKSGNVSGLVRIKIVVDETGSVSSIVWTEGPMLLRQAAQDALRKWKFQPVVVDGKPVRATGYVDFGFAR